MPRRRRDPAPFWWSARSAYCLQVGKKQVRFSADLDEAKILAETPVDRVPIFVNKPEGPLVAKLCDDFLGWCRAHKAPLAYEAYRRRLQHLIDDLAAHGEGPLAVAEFRPMHVSRVLVRLLCDANPEGPILGNSGGMPWTALSG